MDNSQRLAPLYRRYCAEFLRLVRRPLGARLVAVVLYGSVARGEAASGGDVDVLVVASGFPRDNRFRIFHRVAEQLRNGQAYRELEKRGLPRLVSPVPLTPAEVRRHPPLLLDMVYDGVILYDAEGFMGRVLADVRRRLHELRARRVHLGAGRWYWDLKPGAWAGEVIEV